MALSIDGHANGNGIVGGNASASLTTTNANDIIIALVHAENTNASGAPPGVSVSCASPALTFTRRGQVQWHGGFGTAWNTYELWWCFSPTSLTTASIVATITGGNDDSTIVPFGVTGFTGTDYQTNPWDPNVSLPKTNSDTATTTPTASGITTSNPAPMLICGMGTADGGAPPQDATFTLIDTGSNGGGTNDSFQTAGFLLASASGLTVTGASGTSAGWGIIVDALVPAGSGGVTAPLIGQIWI